VIYLTFYRPYAEEVGNPGIKLNRRFQKGNRMTPPLNLVKPLEETTSAKVSDDISNSLTKFRTELVKFARNKESFVDAIICSILSSGHVLIEDVPGVGKTTVIKAISRLLGLEMRRVQCTSDLLPSDIIGVEVFNAASQTFDFHRGPIFSNIVLADELNRASPRTQSALLEGMGEGCATVDRHTYELPKPFFLFASQNPSDHIGTYPLPESQLDRFSVKLRLDYPSEDKETEIFQKAVLDPLAEVATEVLSRDALMQLQTAVENVFISDRVAAYTKRFINATRNHEGIKRGVSTRGGVIWLRVARSRALLYGRDYVTPDDLIQVGDACLSHRVIPHTGNDGHHLISQLLNTVDIE